MFYACKTEDTEPIQLRSSCFVFKRTDPCCNEILFILQDLQKLMEVLFCPAISTCIFLSVVLEV